MIGRNRTRLSGRLALALATLVGAVTTGWVDPVPALAVAAAPTPTASSDLAKYYVVGQPVNGQREYLFAIAATTLGDGRRYPEILQLNLGRQQPDGTQLKDPSDLHPGWILLLPEDASGPRVLIGRRAVLVSPSPDPTPSPTIAADSGQTGLLDEGLVRGIALTAMVVLLGLALWLLRRGTRINLDPMSRSASVARLSRLILSALARPAARFEPVPGAPRQPPSTKGTLVDHADEWRTGWAPDDSQHTPGRRRSTPPASEPPPQETVAPPETTVPDPERRPGRTWSVPVAVFAVSVLAVLITATAPSRRNDVTYSNDPPNSSASNPDPAVGGITDPAGPSSSSTATATGSPASGASSSAPTTPRTTQTPGGAALPAGPSQTFAAVNGYGCPGSASSGFREVGRYTNGRFGWYAVGSGGWTGDGCGGAYDTIDMSGDTRDDPSAYAEFWFSVGPATRTCDVSVFVPQPQSAQDVAGHPTYYQVRDVEGGPVAATFTIDQLSNHGRWVDGPRLAATQGRLVIRLVNRGLDYDDSGPTYAHHAISQIRLVCHR